MKRRHRFFVAVLAVGSAVVAAARIEARDLVVSCDTPGGSIQQALGRFPGEALRIEVQGTCLEHVVIRRDQVELVGVNPTAGIQTPAGDQTGAPLRIEGASDVAVSALTLSGGLYGLEVQNTGPDVRVQDLVLTNNANGVEARRSVLQLHDTDIFAEYAGLVLEYAAVTCIGCEVESGDIPLVVDDHSTLHFIQSAAGNVLTGGGAYVADGSVLELRESVLAANIQAEYGAQVLILSSSVSGPEIVLSFAELAAGFVDASSFVSTLMCSAGGEVNCEPGAFVGSSDCGGCPASP